MANDGPPRKFPTREDEDGEVYVLRDDGQWHPTDPLAIQPTKEPPLIAKIIGAVVVAVVLLGILIPLLLWITFTLWGKVL